MGRPCVFVRLTYCNLRCTYCDTEYAFSEGSRQSIEKVLDAVAEYPCRLVEITGGEPLMQPEVLPLMSALCDHGYEVLLETGGSLDISPVDPRVRRIVDFKSPGSGMAKKNLWANVEHLRSGDEVKFVIGSREDFDWSMDRIQEHSLTKKTTVLFSPVFGVLEPRLLAEWILSSRAHVRLQIQLHKLLWDPMKRGV